MRDVPKALGASADATYNRPPADVAELEYAPGLDPGGLRPVEVRILSSALRRIRRPTPRLSAPRGTGVTANIAVSKTAARGSIPRSPVIATPHAEPGLNQ